MHLNGPRKSNLHSLSLVRILFLKTNHEKAPTFERIGELHNSLVGLSTLAAKFSKMPWPILHEYYPDFDPHHLSVSSLFDIGGVYSCKMDLN